MNQWIPLRWPADWPASALELIKGTPINCLVLGRQEGLAALVQAARGRGLALAGLEGEAPEGVTLIPCAEKSKLNWAAPGAVLAVKDAVWPGIQRGSGAGGGPTGIPWVDSNGWFIQLGQVRAPNKTLWMAVEPPADSALLRATSYELAVADAEAYGARWVVSLDERLRKGLTAGNQEALDTWKKISAALEFFKARRHWNGYQLASVMAVVSDFSGPNEELAGEILNLAARRPLPVLPIVKPGAMAASFAGLKAIIYPDQEPPAEPLRRKLLEFARGGGLLIANSEWKSVEGTLSGLDTYRRLQVRTLGRGRLAVASEEMLDPYAVALDAHLLLSRRHDPVRLFNAGSMNAHYAVSPDRRRAVVHILNYSMRPQGHPVSVSFPARYRAARLWDLSRREAAPLQVFPEPGGTGLQSVRPQAKPPAPRGIELHLPPLQAYAAIELEA